MMRTGYTTGKQSGGGGGGGRLMNESVGDEIYIRCDRI